MTFRALDKRHAAYAHRRPSPSLYAVCQDSPDGASVIDGDTIYVTQADKLHMWRVQNGDARITAFSDVPLTPGTAPAGSKECWTCGKLETHGWRNCPNEELPREERIYRTEVAKRRLTEAAERRVIVV